VIFYAKAASPGGLGVPPVQEIGFPHSSRPFAFRISFPETQNSKLETQNLTLLFGRGCLII
jgi:hypothetical protein